MKSRKFYIGILIIIVVLVAGLFFFNNSATEEELKLKGFYPEAEEIELLRDIADDPYISLNFPAVKRAYRIDGDIKAYVVSCLGYNGPIEVLAALDKEDDQLLGIEILDHIESMDYAGHIEEDWFLRRFKNLLTDKYLNLVVLDKENPEDIVQVTGATVSSQAVVNAVNAAIGSYNYKENNLEMASVPDVVQQEIWSKDINSMAINWEDDSIRIDTESIKEYDQVELDAVLINTTGTETDMTLEGPTLRDILDDHGLDLSDYQGIGITGRDGYYTMVDKEKLDATDVILAWKVDRELLEDEEKPFRIAIPGELGPYWVKMASTIDLYDQITPKNIDKVHIFDGLTEDIEPYYYEYYGSKDKSIEIGKILQKFEDVDIKGFFTMGAMDGLIKNETISMVRQRYFIKVEGDNAPMNIAPNFKLGMNVKNMTHFSTTKDAVVFPDKMKAVVRTKDIEGREGMLLEDLLLTAGMRWEDDDDFLGISRDGSQVEISADDLLESYAIEEDGLVSLYKNREILKDLLRIEKK